jgi:hypothetical protein
LHRNTFLSWGLRDDRPCPQKSYWSSAFKQADIVALVKVISGNTETYNVAVNKAEVLKNFKGAAAGETIYFGAKTVLCGSFARRSAAGAVIARQKCSSSPTSPGIHR